MLPPNKFPLIKIKQAQGFTLLELVVTIIIIGILSVTILPRFFTSSGFEEYSYRADIIAKLRNIQLRSMQQLTQAQGGSECLTVIMNSKHIGVPDTNPCTASASFSNDYADSELKTTEVKIDDKHSVILSSTPANLGSGFGFNNLGQPTGNCSSGCTIRIVGAEPLTVIIEPEGFIHAG